MSSVTDFSEALILDFFFANTAPTRPAGIWIGLFTAAPSDSGGGTEVTGGSYVRKSTDRATDWSRAGTNPTTTSNATVQTFVTPTASWGTVYHFGIFDAATGGNLLWWAPLTAAQTVASGNAVSASINALTFTAA